MACAFAAAAAFAPAGADAQRAAAPRESGGRGTIVHYEETGRSRIVYFEETAGSGSKAAALKPPQEDASTKASRAGTLSTTAVGDAPARRAQPSRVAAAGDPRADR